MKPRATFKDYTIKRIKLFFIALVVLLMVFIVAIIWYLSDETRLKKIIIATVESKIKSQVTIAHANISFSNITIMGLNVYQPAASISADGLVLEIGAVAIDFNLFDLLLGSGIKQATVRQPTIHLCYDHSNKSFNVLSLEMLKKRDAEQSLKVFNLDIDNGVIKYYEKNYGAPVLFTEENIGFFVKKINDGDGLYAFEIKMNKSAIIADVVIAGEISPHDIFVTFDTTFDMESVRFPKQNIMGFAVAHFLETLKPMGRMHLNGKYSSKNDFQIDVTVSQGGVQIPNLHTLLSHQISNINLDIRLNNENLMVNAFTGRLDDYVNLAAHASMTDLNGACILQAHVETVRLALPANQWDALPNDMVTPLHKRGLKLFEALPKKVQTIFEKLRLTGAFDIEVDVKKTLSPSEPIDIKAKLVVKNANISYFKFPYVVSGIKGEVLINKDSVIVGPLVGHHGKNTVSYLDKWWLGGPHGTVFNLNIGISGEKSDNASMRLLPLQIDKPVASGNQVHVVLDDVAVTKSLIEAMPEKVRSTFQRIAFTGIFSGLIDFVVPLKTSSVEKKSVACTIDLQIKDGAVKPEYLHYPLENIHTHVAYADNHFIVSDFQGQHLGAHITGSSEGELGGKFAINLSGKQVVIDAPFMSELRRISNQISTITDQYMASGIVDTDLYIEAAIDGSCQTTVSGAIWLHDLNIESPSFENNFGLINGLVKIGFDKLMLSDVTAQSNGSKLNVDGALYFNQSNKAKLFVTGSGIDIQSQMMPILPMRYQRIIDDTGLTGKTSFAFDLAYIENVEDDLGPLLVVTGSCGVDQVHLDTPLSVDVLSSTANIIEAHYWPNKHAVKLVLQTDFKNATVEDILFTDAQCDISFDSHKDNTWVIDHIDAVLGLGKVAGFLSYVTDGTKALKTELVAHGVNLSDVIPKPMKDTTHRSLGILNGRLKIEQIGDVKSRSGAFELEVSDARWGKLPMGVNLFKLLHLKRPDDSLFNTASIGGVILGDDYHMQNIIIIGDVIQLVGGGVVKMPSGTIELGFGVFTPEHPLTKIPLIKQVSGWIQKVSPVQQVRGTGNIYKVNEIAFKSVVIEVLEKWLEGAGSMIKKPIKIYRSKN